MVGRTTIHAQCRQCPCAGFQSRHHSWHHHGLIFASNILPSMHSEYCAHHPLSAALDNSIKQDISRQLQALGQKMRAIVSEMTWLFCLHLGNVHQHADAKHGSHGRKGCRDSKGALARELCPHFCSYHQGYEFPSVPLLQNVDLAASCCSSHTLCLAESQHQYGWFSPALISLRACCCRNTLAQRLCPLLLLSSLCCWPFACHAYRWLVVCGVILEAEGRTKMTRASCGIRDSVRSAGSEAFTSCRRFQGRTSGSGLVNRAPAAVLHIFAM